MTLVPHSVATGATYAVSFGSTAGVFNGLTNLGTVSATGVGLGETAGLTFNSDYVALVAPTGQTIQPMAGLTALASSADGTMIYGVNPTLGAVVAINASTGSEAQFFADGSTGIASGLAGASALAVSADGTNLFVISTTDPSLVTFSIDPTTHLLTFVSTTHLAATPTAIDAAPAGERTLLIPAGTSFPAVVGAAPVTTIVAITPDELYAYTGFRSPNELYVNTSTGITAGEQVSGTGIAQGTTVISITANGDLVLSQSPSRAIQDFETLTFSGGTVAVSGTINQNMTLDAGSNSDIVYVSSPLGVSAFNGSGQITSVTGTVFGGANGSVIINGQTLSVGTDTTDFNSDGQLIVNGTAETITLQVPAWSGPTDINSLTSFRNSAGNVFLVGASSADDLVYKLFDSAGGVMLPNSFDPGTYPLQSSIFAVAGGPSALVLSPDDREIYVADTTGQAITVLATGLGGTGLKFGSQVQIATSLGLANPTGIAVTPGGQYVLVTVGGANSVLVYQRDAVTGTLTLVQTDRNNSGGAGGLQSPSAILMTGSADAPAATAYVASLGNSASPGGLATLAVALPAYLTQSSVPLATSLAALYAPTLASLSQVVAGPGSTGVIYGVDPTAGALWVIDKTNLAELQGFFDQVNANGLTGASALAVSADGKYLYVTGANVQKVVNGVATGATATRSLAVFAIDPTTGRLTEAAFAQATPVLTDTIYNPARTGNSYDFNPSQPKVVYGVNPTDGALVVLAQTGLGTLQSLSDQTMGADLNSAATTLALSADGSTLTVTDGGTGVVSTFAIASATGLLSETDGSAAFVATPAASLAAVQQLNNANALASTAAGVFAAGPSGLSLLTAASEASLLNNPAEVTIPAPQTAIAATATMPAVDLTKLTGLVGNAAGTVLYGISASAGMAYAFGIGSDGTATLLKQAAIAGTPVALALTADEQALYVATATSVTLLNGSWTQPLTVQSGAAPGLTGVTDIAVSSDGSMLQVATDNGTVLYGFTIGSGGTLSNPVFELNSASQDVKAITDFSTSIASVQVSLTGGGADSLTFLAAPTTTTGNVTLTMGTGNDTVAVQALGARGTLTVQPESGTNSVQVTGGNAFGQLVIDTATGSTATTANTILLNTVPQGETVTIAAVAGGGTNVVQLGSLAASTTTFTAGSVVLTGSAANTTVNVDPSTTLPGNVTNSTTDTPLVSSITPPVVVLTGGTVSEGGTLTLTGTVNDEGTPASGGLAFDLNGDGIYGDAVATPGTTNADGSVSESVTLTWQQLEAFGISQAGTYAVSAQALSLASGSTVKLVGVASTQIVVTYTAPTVAVTIPSTETAVASVGSAYTVNLSAIAPGTEPVQGWSVAWGDGTTTSYTATATSAAHVYANPGAFTVTGTVTDSVGSYAASQKITATVPTSLVSAGGPYTIAQGQSLTLAATAPGTPAGFVWTLDGHRLATATTASVTVPWSTIDTLLLNLGGGVGSATEIGTFTVGVAVSYASQTVATVTTPLTVTETPPTASSLPVTVAQGSPIQLVVTEDSPATSSEAYGFINTFDLTNSGTVSSTSGFISGAASNGGPTTITLPSTIALAPGTYLGTGYATDQNGGKTAFATSITITPVPEAITETLSGTAKIGSAATLNLEARHVLPEAVTSWIVTWGDGTTQTIAATAPNPTTAATGTNDVKQSLSHVYNQPGTFAVDVTAVDQSGTLALPTKTVTVADKTPALYLGFPAAVNEGAATTLTGTIGNVVATDLYVVNVDWGDNGGVTTTTLEAGATGFSLTHLYAAASANEPNGVYPISVFLTDQVPGTQSRTLDQGAEVDPVAPTIADLLLTHPVTSGSSTVSSTVPTTVPTTVATTGAITLGGTVTLTGVVSEPSASESNSISVDWGDGTVDVLTNGQNNPVFHADANGNVSFTDTHAYLTASGAGSGFTVTASATNAYGQTGSASATQSVTRPPPSLRFGLPVDASGTLLATGAIVSGTTGGAITVTGTITDGSALTASTLGGTITWGDGSTASTATITAGAVSGTYTFTASHTYTALFSGQAGGQFDIAATITDPFGLTASGTAIVAPAIPVLTVQQGSTISEGGTVTLTGELTEVGTLNTSTGTITAATHSVVVNWGDGTTSPANAVTVKDSQSGTGAFTASHVYVNPSASGGDTITVTSTDSNTITATATTTETVLDVAATLSGLVLDNATITEGGSVTLTGTISEPGPLDSNTIKVNWGDGSAATTATVTQSGGNGTFTATHKFGNSPLGSQSGAFTIVATATNTAGQTGVGTTSAFVSTVAPTLSGVAVDNASVTAGSLVTLTGTISEPGTLDTSAVSVNWGDGMAAGTASVVQAKGNGTFTATHIYQSAATADGFAITATATNQYGQTGTATAKESVSATTGTLTVSGTIYDWSSHVVLSGVTVYLTNTATALVTTATTDGLGTYSAAHLAAGTYTVTAALPSFTLGRTITASDALAALKQSVGLAAASPYQYIAADVLDSGVITASDALDILKMSVGLTSAYNVSWVFVPETTTYYNATTSSFTIGHTTVPKSFAATLSVTGNLTYNLVGVLRGDVLGSYMPSTSSGTLVTAPTILPVSYFTALSAATGAPLSVWGLAARTTTSGAAAAPLVQTPSGAVTASPVVAVTTLEPVVTLAAVAAPLVGATVSLPLFVPSAPTVVAPLVVAPLAAVASTVSAEGPATPPVQAVAAAPPRDSLVAPGAASQARPAAVTPAAAVRLQAPAAQLPAMVPPTGRVPRSQDDAADLAMMFDEETGELIAWSGEPAGWDLPRLMVDDFGEAWQVLPVQALPVHALGMKPPATPASRPPA